MASSSSPAAKKTFSRSNKAQIQYLCHYMHEHRHFAAGDFKTPQGAAQHHREWVELKAALDELGPSRSVEQWKICWRDQKRKARVEGGALNRAQAQTGNVGDIPDISQHSQIILSTIGEEMAVGCGPQESPIGFIVQEASHSLLPSPQTPAVASTSALPIVVAGPSVHAPIQTTPKRRRVRKITPPEKFINAQLEMNALMKELIKEVRLSNVLRERNSLLIKRSHRRSRN